jgi:hypothetical protein
MLTWIEARRWRVAVFAVLGLAALAAGVFLLADGVKDKSAADKALRAAAAGARPADQDEQPVQALPPIETTDPYIERAAAFIERAFTWRIDTYPDIRAKALAWAADDQAAADIEAMLPDVVPQAHSAGGVAAAWRTGADQVTLRLRQTVVRPVESGNARGGADHLITVKFNSAGEVTSLAAVYARGEVS